MKTLIAFLLLVAILLVGASTPSVQRFVENKLSISACDTPIQYKLGNVDNRFNLSQQEVLNDIQQATSLWSNAANKTLFSYNPQAQLTVNFVYDQRQELDTQIQQMQQQLNTTNKSLQDQINAYYQEQAAFKQRVDQLNSQIQSWNEKGGAPPDVYQQLTQQQQALQQEANQLNDKAKELNLSTSDYNSQVSVLNQDVTQFNTALNQKPEEGLYDPNNDTITIYFASNHNELIHTLAHEFGHSLGMGHEPDPKAIMYPYTTSITSLSQADKNQLAYICRKQNAILLWTQELQLWLHQQIVLYQQQHAVPTS